MTRRPAPVLVVGDIAVDLVLTGDVVPRFGQAEQLLDGCELVLGGSGAIVAAGLAKLGVPTWLCAVAGQDAFGATALGALATAGVHVDTVRVEPSVATGLSVILSAPDDRAILTAAGAIPLLTIGDVLAAMRVSGAPRMHVASPFLMAEFTASLADLIRASPGIEVSLDTNWDPLEQWDAIADALPLVDVLLPNSTELAALGRIADPHAADPAAALAAAGPRVVVKAGAAGGWSLVAAGRRASAPGLEVEVVDTTGAGDSFDAGYLAASAWGIHSEHDRLRWATAAGSLSTRGAGGTAAQPSLDELLAVLGE